MRLSYWCAAVPRFASRWNSSRQWMRLVLVTGFVAGLCLNASADTLTIGLFSFDEFIPGAPGSPGVNVFTINDFTGSSNLPPDAPVATPLTFSNVSVTLNGSQNVSVGSAAPGSTLAPALEFLDTQVFTSATLQGNLSTTTLELADGTFFQASSSLFSVSLLPSAGPDLVADTDFAVLTISGSPASASVPEPASQWLMLPALLAFAYLIRKRRAVPAV